MGNIGEIPFTGLSPSGKRSRVRTAAVEMVDTDVQFNLKTFSLTPFIIVFSSTNKIGLCS